MSGSEGPIAVNLGGGLAGGDCSKVTTERPLMSPAKSVVDALTGRETLLVILESGPPEVVEIRTEDGRAVGSIVPTTELLDCLKKGVPFVAQLSRLTGLSRIRVRAA